MSPLETLQRFTAVPPEARYRTIEDRVLTDPELTLDETLWARLEIPVRLAFFTWDDDRQAEAVYPAAAGTGWAPVRPEAWAELARTRLVQALRPRVDALLVCGLDGSAGPMVAGTFACFGVSIDRCFALMGLLRQNWRGFAGGPRLWQATDAYFTDLRARAVVLRE